MGKQYEQVILRREDPSGYQAYDEAIKSLLIRDVQVKPTRFSCTWLGEAESWAVPGVMGQAPCMQGCRRA